MWSSLGRAAFSLEHAAVAVAGAMAEAGSGATEDDVAFLMSYIQIYEKIFVHTKALYWILVLVWLFILFHLLYEIAERHFIWALGHFSKYCRMSPDLAGMTLLAVGNGAPDFFTAVFGAGEAPEMILASSVGSGLFILTVVFGLAILFAKNPSKGAVVICEDGTLQSVAKLNDEVLQHSHSRHRLEAVPFIRGSLMYLFCVVVLGVFSTIKKIPFWMPLILLGTYFSYVGSVAAMHFYATSEKRSTSVVSSVVESLQVGEERKQAWLAFNNLSFFKKVQFSLYYTCCKESWSLKWYKFVFYGLSVLLKAPISLALNISILPMENPDHSKKSVENFVSLRFLHRLRCIVNPFASIIMYFFLLGPGLAESGKPRWLVWGGLAAFASMLSAALWLTTAWERQPRCFSMHVFFSFCTCILWIYAASSELVSCLVATGKIGGISPTIMGILVLAWGNSFGDLVADVAIAKNGGFQTAVGAIFSGPIQNVLLTIGAGFLVATLRKPDYTIIVRPLRLDLYFSLVVLSAVILLCLLLAVLKFDFRIPRNFGFVLLTIYMLYLPCTLLIGLKLVQVPFS